MRYADSHEIVIEKEPFHTAYAHNKEEQINNESEYRIADTVSYTHLDVYKRQGYAFLSIEYRLASVFKSSALVASSNIIISDCLRIVRLMATLCF